MTINYAGAAKHTVPDRQLEKEIANFISHSDLAEDPKHSIITKKWVLAMYPKAPYYLQIAALAHDIERGSPNRLNSEQFSNYNIYKKKHSEIGAKIIGELLKKHNYGAVFVRKVSELVRLHEFGGSREADMLRDADTISFFEYNIYFHYRTHRPEQTFEKAKWMYRRASRRVQGFVRTIPYHGPVRGLMMGALKR